MPGKLFMGLDALGDNIQSSKVDVAKAYCEGRQHQASGGLIAENPHALFPKSESRISWEQGFLDKEGGSPLASETGCAI